jgi:hypothetical protein
MAMREWGLLAAGMMLGGCHFGLLGMVMTAHDQGPYLPETLASELGPASVRTIGCLDVGFAVHERDATELLDLHVGNRCAHPEALHVSRLAIRAVDERGESRAVTISDPRDEIAKYHVGGSERGRERLRLLNAKTLASLCFDLGAVAPDVPEAKPAPLCFRRESSGWKPESP